MKVGCNGADEPMVVMRTLAAVADVLAAFAGVNAGNVSRKNAIFPL